MLRDEVLPPVSPRARQEAGHASDGHRLEVTEVHLAEVILRQLLQSRGSERPLEGQKRALVVDVPADILPFGLEGAHVLLEVSCTGLRGPCCQCLAQKKRWQLAVDGMRVACEYAGLHLALVQTSEYWRSRTMVLLPSMPDAVINCVADR